MDVVYRRGALASWIGVMYLRNVFTWCICHVGAARWCDMIYVVYLRGVHFALELRAAATYSRQCIYVGCLRHVRAFGWCETIHVVYVSRMPA
eukprot:3902996-Pyramimonas_sp.AAC.1